ncbi:hypothetical protein B0H10DRAFT_307017 [Mycena sp. CBHHK59/15]|nr:hypothetical protein B0H10DRAFT_307017 [Mycena sp. CBHHK59/15]
MQNRTHFCTPLQLMFGGNTRSPTLIPRAPASPLASFQLVPDAPQAFPAAFSPTSTFAPWCECEDRHGAPSCYVDAFPSYHPRSLYIPSATCTTLSFHHPGQAPLYLCCR